MSYHILFAGQKPGSHQIYLMLRYITTDVVVVSSLLLKLLSRRQHIYMPRLKYIENVTRCREGRDDSIKQFSTQLHHTFPLLKICRVGLDNGCQRLSLSSCVL